MKLIVACLFAVLVLAGSAAAQEAGSQGKSKDKRSVEATNIPAERESASQQDGPKPVEPPMAQPSQSTGQATEDIAQKATDPSAVLMQMQFQYIPRVIEDADADASTLIIQPVLPLGGRNVLRATLPILSTPEPDRVSGLGDLVVLDFFLFKAGKSSLGVGPALSFPTATDDALGSGKLSLGPTFLWIYKGIPKTILGLLMENLTSVAGDSDRSDVNTILFQPIYTRHFKWGYLGWSGQQMSYDWENDAFSLPLGVVLGKVFKAKTPWNISVEPFYQLNTQGPNAWGVKFQWTAIFPSFHW